MSNTDLHLGLDIVAGHVEEGQVSASCKSAAEITAVHPRQRTLADSMREGTQYP